MFVVDKIYVRGVKLIDDLILVRNIGEIIHKDHQRALEEGLKLFGMSLPGRSKTTEQSTARRPVDALSMGVIDGDLAWGKEERLGKSLNPPTVASTARQWADAPSMGSSVRVVSACRSAAKSSGEL